MPVGHLDVDVGALPARCVVVAAHRADLCAPPRYPLTLGDRRVDVGIGNGADLRRAGVDADRDPVATVADPPRCACWSYGVDVGGITGSPT